MKLIKRLIMLSMFFPIYCYATTDDQLHLAAHVGTTYGITHATDVVCKKFNASKTSCIITGIVLANTANVGYKAMEGFPNDTKRAVIGGLIGSGLAGVVISIDW